MKRLFFIFIISVVFLSCGDEGDYYKNINQRLLNEDLINREPVQKEGVDIKSILGRFNKYLNDNERRIYIFDFGNQLSPYVDGSIVVTQSNRSIYHRWINNYNILNADQMLINPLFTDFLVGESGNEILFNIPSGEYEITFVIGSEKSDVLPFKVEINSVEYTIYSKEFTNFASKRGYYSFNTIEKLKVDKNGVRIVFKDSWLINAIIIKAYSGFSIKKYSSLPVRFHSNSDFYKLLSRENAIKWSRKFGYNYEANWDYVLEKSDEILNMAGIGNLGPFEKLKYIADYVDRNTRERCCYIPETEILDSPVDILDPDGYQKGSCFGLARLMGILANSYGLPARLVGYFIDSDFSEFPSLSPLISSPLFVVKPAQSYSTFAIGGYNHTEVEVFYQGKWRLITNYFFEPHLAEYSAIEVVNNKGINSVKRSFYDNVQDVMFVNLFIANINREPDFCILPYSYAFYDLDTASSIYPENTEWTFKMDNHISSVSSLRIGRFWGLSGILRLSYDNVKRVGRELFIPKIESDENIVLNIMVVATNRDIEENLNIYINGRLIAYKPLDIVRNMDFSKRRGSVFQFRVKIDKNLIVENRLNEFDIELKDSASSVAIVVGSNDNRISGYDTFTMDYCNNWDMMKSSNSYYYSGSNRYPLYNNPLIFLEIVN